MKIYIAGKITGDPKYREKFKEAAADIARGGHIPLNPADLPEGMRPKDYMCICFAMIDVADLAVFLPDAKDSAGCGKHDNRSAERACRGRQGRAHIYYACDAGR